MSKRLLIGLVVTILAIVAGAWAVSRGISRLTRPTPVTTPAESTPVDAQVAHISATIFYRAPDDDWLVPVRREVPLGESVVEQGRHILDLQLQPAPAPRLSVIPAGTTLRSFYVSERGEAFVDLSLEARTAHPGGSTMELLTVYAIVNAITSNLPTIQRVQILIDGKEVDTLAGHVDLRRPLALSMLRVQPDARAATTTTNMNTSPDGGTKNSERQ